MDKILVIGGGSWGTAIANYLATHKSHPIKLWIREEEVLTSILSSRENTFFFFFFKLSPNLTPVRDLEKETQLADILMFAIPSKFIRATFQKLTDHIQEKLLVCLSKGFESASQKTISQLAVETFGERILNRWITISGPSFARELANCNPTAVVAASQNPDYLNKIQDAFSSHILRIYRSDDLRGVEIAGSIKNVIAIASGILHGLNYGYNSTASLVTRANMEITRFGLKLGAKRETFWGLAGIGDLMLTCFGPLSRNFQLGVEIAKGKNLDKIISSSRMIAEGVETTKAIKKISDEIQVDMPIVNEVYNILFDNKDAKTALKELMKRSLKTEWNIN